MRARSSETLVAESKRAENPHAHRIVKQISDLLDAQSVGRKEAARSAGLTHSTVPEWFRSNVKPFITQVGAVANVVGHRIAIEKCGVVRRDLVNTRRQGATPRYLCPDAHPLVHEIVRLADYFNMSLERAGGAVGIKKSTLQAWTGNRCNVPSLERADTMLSVFGLRLALEPIR